MSYILDALSKSQRERERAAVPTLTTAFPVTEPKRRAPRALIGATLGLLAAAALIATFALSGRASMAPTSSRVTVAGDQPPPMPATATDSNAVIAERATSHAPANTDAGTPRSKAEPAKSDGAKDGTGPRRGQANIARDTRVAEAVDTSQGVLSDGRLSDATRWLVKEISTLERKSAPRKAVSSQDPPVANRKSGDTTVAMAAAATANTRRPPMPDRGMAGDSELSTPANDEIPALGDLPAEWRSRIPALEVNVHAYAASREERMVFINMKRYGEGDRLVEGPIIDAITPDGVVLVHEQRRFRLPAR